MKKVNWNEIEEAAKFEKLPAGGYICRVTAVEDFEEKEYLKIEFDIAEGVHKEYYRSLYEAKSFWGGNFIRSYKTTALPFFKAFKTAVENSNKGYAFDESDIGSLKQKYIGIVIAYEQYIAKDGATKERAYAAEIRSIEAIKKNNFEVPSLKLISAAIKAPPIASFDDFKDVTDDDSDLPF